MSSKDRDIAMVFQELCAVPAHDGGGEHRVRSRLRKVPKAEIKRKVVEAAAVLGLSEWLERKPGQLSGGQRQRVAMGRAIVREPAVFLMDEPLSNLDAKLRVQMRTEVSRIQRRIGVATLYVTHDQTEAMTMGDRVAVLRLGDLQQCDRPQVLYNTPRNLFVAAFIGSPAMNLFDAALSEDGASITVGSQTIAVPEDVHRAKSGLAAYRGRKLVIGIRPEDLPTLEPGDKPQSVLTGDVVLVEALGSELLVHFSIDANRVHVEDVQDRDLEDAGELTVHGEGVARVSPRAVVKAGDRTTFAASLNECTISTRRRSSLSTAEAFPGSAPGFLGRSAYRGLWTSSRSQLTRSPRPHEGAKVSNW